MVKRKGKLLILGISFAVVISGILIWVLTMQKDEYVGTVNGNKITAEEYLQAMSPNIANIISKYSEEYEKGTPQEFWGASNGNNAPLKELQQKTQSDLLEKYAILELAKEYGLIENIDYRSLEKALEVENKHRNDPNRTEPIYGPTNYQPSEYLAYLLSEFTAELTELMQKNGTISISEKEILEAYEKNPMMLGATDPYYRVLEAKKTIDSPADLTKQEVADVIQHLKTDADPDGLEKGWTISERIVDENNFREMSRVNPEMLEMISPLEAGEVSVCSAVGNTGVIYKMLECEQAKPLPYEEMKSAYKKRLAEAKFKEIIAKKCKDSSVTWEELALPLPGKE